ncbi:MAG: hypothetical protein Q7T50_07285, partial [Candidatus Magasanikbacteria bacterium]|nr:hypothetical protein [Candidatus Magasanikbacteria bacterium]
MKLKILLTSLLLMFFALPVLALDFPDPPVALPFQIGDKTVTQAIEWQAYTGIFWIAYRYDQLNQPTSKGMTLEHWYGDSNHYLHPMRAIATYYSWDGTKWNKNPGYSYWNVRIAHGADWQTKIRANYDIYYYQESSPYYFDWTNRYTGIGVAYADYPSLVNPTLLMTANWDYGLPPKFKITSPIANEMHTKDTWITVSGTCP